MTLLSVSGHFATIVYSAVLEAFSPPTFFSTVAEPGVTVKEVFAVTVIFAFAGHSSQMGNWVVFLESLIDAASFAMT
jgi:hypothetical protein